jgi:hypothetical protein
MPQHLFEICVDSTVESIRKITKFPHVTASGGVAPRFLTSAIDGDKRSLSGSG